MSKSFVIAIVAIVFGTFGCPSRPQAVTTTTTTKKRTTTTTAPAPQPTTMVSPSPNVARGAYVAALSGCMVCHVKGGGPDRAPNITPDRDTGIGTWSDSQIIVAFRQGVRPDGARLAPTMPYPYFHAMTNEDAYALVSYLRTVPPARFVVARASSKSAPAMLPPPENNIDPIGDQVGHGAYLAAIMACGSCHTPTSGPATGHLFAGGNVMDHVVASNITPDAETGIGTWTEAEIVRCLRTMLNPHGLMIRPPMADYRDGWVQLSDADLEAVAAYLKSVTPVNNPVGRAPAGPVTSAPCRPMTNC